MAEREDHILIVKDSSENEDLEDLPNDNVVVTMFPWTKDPCRVKGISKDKLIDLEKLNVSLLSSFYPVNCNVLIENEWDTESIHSFMAEDNLVSEKTAYKTDSDKLKTEIAFQYEEGFDKAIGQVKFLYPDLNVDTVGAFKEIRDGKIVDIPDDEE
ncbi:hypothetical protein SESBI_06170 [Sesbania bispinosa]|nr:hypothetical protein SESBI_06170 [Sesbania bispinosa]